MPHVPDALARSSADAAARSAPLTRRAARARSPLRLRMPGDVVAVLVVALAWFAYAYALDPHLPGHEAKLGWFGWSDQAAYLNEARAMLAGDQDPDRYRYPYGYPLLAVPFLALTPRDPFLLPNAAAYAATVCLSYAAARERLGRHGAALTVVLLLLASPLTKLTLVPWNTTPALVTAAYWWWLGLRRGTPSTGQAALGGFALALTALSRGGGEVICLAPLVGVTLLRSRRAPGFATRVLVVGGAVLGVAVLSVGATLALFGTPVQPYYQTVTSSQFGFDVTAIPSHLWGTIVGFGAGSGFWPPLLRDAGWLVLAPLGAGLAVRRAAALRAVHVGAVATLVLAFLATGAYGAFKAENLRFFNLHYVKMWLPLLAFYAVAALARLAGAARPTAIEPS